ncbi:hypothetical protein RB595_005134 [Gaeumannomyces hyphopodioides]
MTELAVGQIIELSDGRQGVIRFVGRTSFAQGDWVGVELDDDSGKNDGSVQGERYFDCPLGHGMFVRPTTCTVLADAPPPAPAPRPAPAAKKPAPRLSTGGLFTGGLFTGGGMSARGTGSDPTMAKRMSLNAPSPTPGARTSRAASMSPTKSPTKQMVASVPGSRTATPSGGMSRTSIGAKLARPSTGGPAPRTSMGPPPPPGPRPARPSSTTSRTVPPAGGPARPPSARPSLGGPRPPGARPPSLQRPPTQTNGRSTSSKRASDDSVASAKTGEMEILSPQPTSPVRSRAQALEKLTSPAPAPAASGTGPAAGRTRAPTAAGAAAANREIEDLKTKLKVLERQRQEDRDKIKELDLVQGERDKFQAIIAKIQAKLQPQQLENAELRKQVKEYEMRVESVETLQAEHDQVLELATLDREMAEETAEVLKQELSDVKQKLEELELEVDILREENTEYNKGITPEERSSAGWLQLERNNERLREALIRLRDMSQQQEKEMRDEIKGLEDDLQEAAVAAEQLAAAKEKLSQTESIVEDLRQQLETALGAEEMIEDLTDRNMSQAEQIEELKAEVEDLENLKEIADELEANHVQHERELQEEIDFKNAVITEQARRSAQQEDSLDEMEYTLSRFRELVTSLQSDLEDMRASHAVTETESEQLNSKSRAMMDLNMKLQISASKAQVKTIDLELRRLEAQEAEQHLEIVKMFLPESYQADRDSVLALLRFRRLAFKANLLNGFIRERVNGQPHAGHEDDVFAGCDVVDKLTWVSAMCERFVNAIGQCSPERFSRFEGALYELEPVERALNGWIDGLRRDELKESQCADELSRTISLMTHLGEVHIGTGASIGEAENGDDNGGDAKVDLKAFADNVHMRALMVQSHLDSAAATFHATRAMVQRVIPPAGDDDELAQHFARKAEAAISQTRSAKVVAGKAVRALEDLRSRSLALAPDGGASADAFDQAEAGAAALAALARRIGLDLHTLLHEEGRTEPYTYTEVQSAAHRTALAATGSSESDLFSAYTAQLRAVSGQVVDLAALAQDLGQAQEFERSPAPWVLRAQELRAQRTAPADAEEEMRHLREEYNEARRQVALREEGFSTAQVKIETLEARMRDAHQKVQRIAELEEAVARERASATSLKDDIEKQDRELKGLEADRDKWKKVAGDARLAAAADPNNANGASDAALDSAAAAGREMAVATAREMDELRAEIEALQSSVRFLREDGWRARTAEQASHDWLAEPLQRKPRPSERRRALVAAEGRDALAELLRMASSAKVFDLAKARREAAAAVDSSADGAAAGKKLSTWRPARSTPQYHAAKQAEDYAVWRSWQDSILHKSQQVLLVGASDGDGVPADEAAAASSSSLPASRSEATRAARKAAARLQIRLPGVDGKMATTGRGHVQIVGSREWEGLQGRLAAV